VAFDDVERAAKKVLDGTDQHRLVETAGRPSARLSLGVRIAFLHCSGVELQVAACRVRRSPLAIGRTVGVLFVETLEGEVAPLIAGRGALERIPQAQNFHPSQQPIERVIVFITVGGDHDTCGHLEFGEGLAIEKDDAADLLTACRGRNHFALEPVGEGLGAVIGVGAEGGGHRG